MKVLSYRKLDGSVTVVYPVAPKLPGETESNYLQRIAARRADIRGVALYRVMDHTELPKRRFRNSWRMNAGTFSVDMPSARQQILKELREERNLRLEDSDMEKAHLDDVGTEEEKIALRQYRQRLRDLPVSVSAEIDLILDLPTLEAYKPTFPE